VPPPPRSPSLPSSPPSRVSLLPTHRQTMHTLARTSSEYIQHPREQGLPVASEREKKGSFTHRHASADPSQDPTPLIRPCNGSVDSACSPSPPTSQQSIAVAIVSDMCFRPSHRTYFRWLFSASHFGC
jgi:hypothetical protein